MVWCVCVEGEGTDVRARWCELHAFARDQQLSSPARTALSNHPPPPPHTPLQVRVPRIHWSATSRRVLTMEWIEGVKLTDEAAMAARGGERRHTALATSTSATSPCEGGGGEGVVRCGVV